MEVVFFRWPCGNGFQVKYSNKNSIKELIEKTENIKVTSFEIKAVSNNKEVNLNETLQ